MIVVMCFGGLLDLDSRQLDVSADLQAGNVVRVASVSVRGPSLTIYEDLNKK